MTLAAIIEGLACEKKTAVEQFWRLLGERLMSLLRYLLTDDHDTAQAALCLFFRDLPALARNTDPAIEAKAFTSLCVRAMRFRVSKALRTGARERDEKKRTLFEVSGEGRGKLAEWIPEEREDCRLPFVGNRPFLSRIEDVSSQPNHLEEELDLKAEYEALPPKSKVILDLMLQGHSRREIKRRFFRNVWKQHKKLCAWARDERIRAAREE